MAAAAPLLESMPSAHLSSSPRAAGSLTRLPAPSYPDGHGGWIAAANVKPAPSKSAQASPALQYRQVATIDGMTPTAPGHQDGLSSTTNVDFQRRIEDLVDVKMDKVLEEIRAVVAQRIDAFMEKLRCEKASRERSLSDVQRQLDELGQKGGTASLVPFEDLARMTSAAASKLEASVDHAQRCCESAREAMQRDMMTFRHEVEEHRTKHFAEIAALCANKLQTSDSEQQLSKKSATEVGLAEVRQELEDRCSAMNTALQQFSAQVQRLQGQAESGVHTTAVKSDAESLQEVRTILEKKDDAMSQDIEALRLQVSASSAVLKEQLGQHLDRTVDSAQAALMRSFLEEHKALISSLLEERESRTQEILLLNARLDRIVKNSDSAVSAGTGSGLADAADDSSKDAAASNGKDNSDNSESLEESQKDQDSESVRVQLASLRDEMSSLRNRSDQLNQLFLGDAAAAGKLVEELRESKRTWSVDSGRMQEQFAESLQSIGSVQTQFKEMQDWRQTVDMQLLASGLAAAKASEEKAAAAASTPATPSGARDAEVVSRQVMREMSSLRGEVKTSLESAVTAVRLGEQLASEIQAERQARRKDFQMLHGLLVKGTPRDGPLRVAPPSQGFEDTNVSNSALSFQARLLNRSTVPSASSECLPQLRSEATLPEANVDVNLEELNMELQRRLYDRVLGASTTTEPASGSTSVVPNAKPTSSGRQSAVSPLWPARDLPRVPLLDLSMANALQGNRDSEANYAPEHDSLQADLMSIASRRALQGNALWSSQSCHSVGSVAVTPGAASGTTVPTGTAPSLLSGSAWNVSLTPMSLERFVPQSGPPLASPGAVRSMSSQRPRPTASPSTGGLRNIQPQPGAGLEVALSTGGPVRQSTLPTCQRLPSASSLAAAPNPGSVSVNVAPAGLMQVRGPSPRMDGHQAINALQQLASSHGSHGSPTRSRHNTRTSMASTASPDRGNASPLRPVTTHLAFQGSSASVSSGLGAASLRNSSPRIVQVARSVSPLRMSRRSNLVEVVP